MKTRRAGRKLSRESIRERERLIIAITQQPHWVLLVYLYLYIYTHIPSATVSPGSSNPYWSVRLPPGCSALKLVNSGSASEHKI